MRLIKLVPIAAIITVAALALFGASSAMASDTALCTTDSAGSTCPPGQLTSHVHLTVIIRIILLNSIQNVQCGALFLGDVQNPTLLGSPLEIAGNLTYTNCTTGCEAKQISAETTVKVLQTAPELSEVKGEGEVLVNCSLILHCVYNGNGLTGHGLGGLTTNAAEKGHTTFSGAALEKVSGLLCPSSASLDALFESLEKQYLRS
jgi:hypothetical protein